MDVYACFLGPLTKLYSRLQLITEIVLIVLFGIYLLHILLAEKPLSFKCSRVPMEFWSHFHHRTTKNFAQNHIQDGTQAEFPDC